MKVDEAKYKIKTHCFRIVVRTEMLGTTGKRCDFMQIK